MSAGIEAPAGERWRQFFHSDGSETTGSVERHGRPFIVLRRRTEAEADPGEDGEIPLWRIQFTDDNSEFDAWSDEIMRGWTNEPPYRPEDYAKDAAP